MIVGEVIGLKNLYNQDLPASNSPSAGPFHPASVFAVYALTAQCRFSSFNLMQIVALHLNPLIFTMAVLQEHLQRGWSARERGGIGGEGERNAGLGRPSDKHLTPAPRRCGLNVACLLQAGFGNRGLSGPSPLQEPLRDCHGMEPMH